MKIQHALVSVCVALVGCTTVPIDSPQPAELSLGRGSRVAIVPEGGNDSGELAMTLSQGFASQGFYEMVDRWNLGQTINERNFQRMSFVDGNAPRSRIRGADAFIYVGAGALARNFSDSSSYTIDGRTFHTYTSGTTVNYSAGYRVVQTGSSQLAGARKIDLDDTRKNSDSDGYPAPPDAIPIVAGLRERVAQDMFNSLHPRVLKTYRTVAGTKSQSAKAAVQYAKAGLWPKALESARAGVRERPQDIGALHILAVVCQGSGRYGEAQEVFTKLVGMKGGAKFSKDLQFNSALASNAARYYAQVQ
jgi:hypothetical protein